MLAASGVEFFIFLLLMGASALFNWMKKRAEEKEAARLESEELLRQRSAPPPVSPRSSPSPASKPAKALDWEEELKRMLGEVEIPTTSAPPPIPPPPPPVVRRNPPMPPPPVSPPPQPAPSRTLPAAFQPKISKGHCEHCDTHLEFPSEMAGDSIICPHCRQRTTLTPFRPTRVDELAHQREITQLKEAESAYRRAKMLEDRVETRLAEAVRKPVEMTHVFPSKARSVEVRQVVTLFHAPHTARQAMMASLILGKPKALEN